MKSERKHKEIPLRALVKIMDHYPEIPVSDIQYFTPYYHPIAEITVDLLEKSYEDFRAVELYILKLLGQNIRKAEVLAQLLGLEKHYVENIVKVLEGYGHLDHGEVTALGLESIREEKKILTLQVKQKFQCDAVNLRALRSNKKVSEIRSFSQEHTSLSIPHLPYEKGLVPVAELTGDLKGEDLNVFRQQNRTLQSNILEIRSVEVDRLFFAEAFMMIVKGASHPFLFTEVYDSSKSEMKERFYYELLGRTSSTSMISEENLEKTSMYKEVAMDSVRGLEKFIREASQIELQKEEILTEELLKEHYPFNMEHVETQRTGGSLHPVKIFLNEDAVTTYHRNLPDLLRVFGADGKAYLPVKKLNGRMIRVISKDSKFNELAERFQKTSGQTMKHELSEKMVKHFRNLEEPYDLFDEMDKVLAEVKHEK